MEQLGQTEVVDRKLQQVVIISQDCFYKNLNEEEKELAKKGLYNFDHPGMLCSSVESWNTNNFSQFICIWYFSVSVI